jgi:misacylated tRNA(Ala) deacylase
VVILIDEARYMDDMYMKEWDAKVVDVSNERFIVLDKSAFYPNSGGVEYDKGTLVSNDGAEYKVIFAGKFEGHISHEVDKIGLRVGDNVHCNLDWERRHILMRYHTAAHILSGLFNKETRAKITGNQITPDKGRIDFDLEDFDRAVFERLIIKANELIANDLPVIVYYKPREEALKDPNMVKLANAMPPAVTNIRVVDIKGFDYQADGGCHVMSLKEVGMIEFLSAENKGKNNRRVYFKVKE